MTSSPLNSKWPGPAALLMILIPVLAANIWCGVSLFKLTVRQSSLKEDYAEVNSIRNGLLSVDVWKTHLKEIASEKITHFNLTPKEEEAVRSTIETSLHAFMAQTDKIMRHPQKTFRGKVKRLTYEALVDTHTLSEQTPDYAQAILDELQKPENLEKIKELVLSQFEKTESVEGSEETLHKLLAKYNADTIEDFNTRMGATLRSFRERATLYASVMIGSLLLFLAVWWGLRQRRDLYKMLFTLSVALAFIVLVSALVLPMIDIDARIKNVDFLLLGKHLQFTNQLIFYRSKSIMQMVRILLSAGKPETILVGILIFLFSIIFPMTKLSSTLIGLFGNEKWRAHRLVHFFAYESGKWSMADVMVVAIFMAYIGFNSVLNSQLQNLNIQSEAIGVITTNETALQPGFPLFLAFVLFGLALSVTLKRIQK